MPGLRRTAGILVTVFAALVWAGSASAAPSLDIFWSGTTGAGATGGSVIDAEVGDTLTLDVVLTIDPQGFTGAAWDLVGSANITAATNALIGPPGAGGPPECPAPPNLAPGTCFSATFKSFSPLAVGVIDAGNSTIGYDVAGLTAEFIPSTITVGRGVFLLSGAGGGTASVSTFFAPGVGGVTDGSFGFSVPAVSQALINVVPEPGTLSVLGLGTLGVLIVARRRRD